MFGLYLFTSLFTNNCPCYPELPWDTIIHYGNPHVGILWEFPSGSIVGMLWDDMGMGMKFLPMATLMFSNCPLFRLSVL